MTRLKLALIFLGGAMCWLGFNELKVGEGATPEPQPVELAELEAGSVPDNTHLEIGPHWRMYQELVFRYETKRGASEEDVTESTKVDYAYFPVLSTTHPFFRDLGNLLTLYGDFDAIPEDQMPEVGQFKMLIKTTEHATVGALPPPSWAQGESVSGLVINRIYSLKGDERDLIAQAFPNVSLDDVIVLEEGRRPATASKVFGLMGGGAGVSLAGIGWLLVGFRRREETAAVPETVPEEVAPIEPR